MRISIIGAGNIGGTLAKKWKAAGHTIIIGARDPQDADTIQAAAALDAKVTTIPKAVDEAEAILIATPGKAVKDLVDQLGDKLRGKLVMDATNMAGPPGTPAGFNALREAGADAVKVFNCTGWENLADVNYGDMKADMFMAGGSGTGRSTARRLAKDVGFDDAIDLGGDDKVHILESFALLWIDLAIMQNMGRGVAFKLLKR